MRGNICVQQRSMNVVWSVYELCSKGEMRSLTFMPFSHAVSPACSSMIEVSSHALDGAIFRGMLFLNSSVVALRSQLVSHSDIRHDEHCCETVQCPITCQLCKRLCSERDHFHGLNSNAVHLCGYVIVINAIVSQSLPSLYAL